MSLVRSFMTVGGATMASRVLGFVRDSLLAAGLGTGPVADAFFVAFRLPNLFRRLFAEGAFNSAFVPLYARALESEGESGAKRFAAETLAGLLLVLVLFSAAAMVGAPLLVWILAPGFLTDPTKFELTTLLTRICFPYLAFMSLTAMLGGVLNAHGRFLAAALAPVLLNVILIAVLAGVAWGGLGRTEQAGVVVSIGVAVAGLAQFAMLWIAVRRSGWSFGLVRPRWTPDMKRLVALGVPGVIAGGITQINIVVGTIIASMSAGAVSFLYYADRVYQLPLGVVGVAIGVVLLPEVARQVRSGREDLAFHAQNRSLEFAAVLTLPAATALVAAATPIVGVLFERGAFGPEDTRQTAAALVAFGFGLPAFVFVKVFSPGFFAREDTRTPMWVGAATVAINIALSIALFPLLGHVAVAVGTSVSGWVNALVLFAILIRRGHWRVDGELETRLPRIALCAIVTGVVVRFAADLLAAWTGAENPLFLKVAALGGLVTLGVTVFFGLAQVTGGVDLARIRDQILRKPGAAPARSAAGVVLGD